MKNKWWLWLLAIVIVVVIVGNSNRGRSGNNGSSSSQNSSASSWNFLDAASSASDWWESSSTSNSWNWGDSTETSEESWTQESSAETYDPYAFMSRSWDQYMRMPTASEIDSVRGLGRSPYIAIYPYFSGLERPIEYCAI